MRSRLAHVSAVLLASLSLVACAREQTVDVFMDTAKRLPNATCIEAALKKEFPNDDLRTRERDWLLFPQDAHAVAGRNGSTLFFEISLVDVHGAMNARVAATWTKPSAYSDAQRALLAGYPKRALDRIAVDCITGHTRPLTCAPEKADGMCPPANP